MSIKYYLSKLVNKTTSISIFSISFRKRIIDWFRKRLLTEVIIDDFLEDFKLILYPSKSIGQWKYLINYRSHDQENFEFLTNIVKPGNNIIDIGANIGFYTLFFKKLVGIKGAVVSIEPFKDTFDHLIENLKINNINTDYAFNLALSDKEEKLQIFEHKENDGKNSLIQDPNNSPKYQIVTKKFDDFFQEKLVQLGIDKVTLIKIDVEGWEIHVLQGAQKYLEINSPLLMIEFNGEKYFDKSLEVFKFLNNIGYSCFSIVGKKLLKIKEKDMVNFKGLVFDVFYSKIMLLN